MSIVNLKSKNDRHAFYRAQEQKGQLYSVKSSPSNRAKCRICHKSIGKGVLRIDHLVCGHNCFTEKATGKKDGCGKYHLDCFLKAQKEEHDRFLRTNQCWVPVESISQLEGVDKFDIDGFGELQLGLQKYC